MGVRSGWIATGLAAATLLAAAPAALGFGLENLTAAPADTQAGANSDVGISLEVSEPEADLRDLTIHLPPGLVGNPLATPQCTEEQLNADACPAESDVGDVANDVTLQVLGFLPVDQTVSGELYNMVPREGEPARFGIVLNALPFNVPILGPALLPPIITQSPARLRPDDFGLDSILTDLPNTATVAGLPTDIDINSVALTLAGVAGNPPQGFIRNPTSCREHLVGFDAVAYSGATASGQAAFTTGGCENVPFSPELTAKVAVSEPGGPVELQTTISQTIEEAGLARAEVVLPVGLAGNSNLLGNTCPRPSFEAGSCPPESVVGSASASSPLQAQPLTGPVVLVAPASPGLPDVGLDLRGSLALKLTGSLALGADGRNITTFAGLPDIPIADFTLTFGREPGLIGSGIDICDGGALVVDGNFTAHSGATLSDPAPVELSGCGGGPPGTKPKRPKAKLKLSGERSAQPRLALKVKAGDRRLRKVRLGLPKGVTAAAGKRLDRGGEVRADGSRLPDKRLRGGRRALAVKLGRTGAQRLQLKVGGGALRVDGRAKRFRVKVTDVGGKTTRLRIRAK
jgi:hypothetical protein